MDIDRKDLAVSRRRKRLVWSVAAVAMIALITLGVSQLKPAPPVIARSGVWIDEVKRGNMLRQVRGSGTLVPEEIRWIAASTDGRVERILVQPGTLVEPDTVLMELTEPQQVQRDLDAELQLRAAVADLSSLQARLDTQRLDRIASEARLKAEYEQARLRADTDEALARQGLLADLNRKLSQNAAQELEKRYSLEQERRVISEASIESQLAAQRAKVDQFRSLAGLQRSQTASLRVRAGIRGVLQHSAVEIGQRVTAGSILAKVVDPGRLKAQLKIAETQAKDITFGQTASIDTRNGIITARVTRIDPAAQNGTVAVDVRFDGPLPAGARPDLTVDGTIELERLTNVLYVGRPVSAQERATGSLFRLDPNGSDARRVTVRFGRSSVSQIEIAGGLEAGDRVILSDMSNWDRSNLVRLK